jgi:hypothetical protein
MKNEILVMLTNYLSGRISREQFEDWFIPATWDASGIEDPDTLRLVRRIKLRLAEFLNGDWSEDELRDNLSTLVDRVPVYRIAMPAAASGRVEITTSSTGDEIPVRRRLVLA